MSITYRRAPTVAVGDKIKSSDLVDLANAINDRMRPNLGDPVFRINHYWTNIFRQVRNQDGTGAFPPQGEFFDFYQHIEPEARINWAVAGAGDPEGVSTNWPLGTFVFGNAFYDDEETRIGPPAFNLWNGTPPSTPLEFWELRKLQAGVYAPLTGAQNVPALEAALSGQYIRYGGTSPIQKAYGGFFPTPDVLDAECGTTEETGVDVASYEIFFTGLSADADIPDHHGTLSTNGDGMPVITYAGSCPWNTDDTGAGHVQDVIYLPRYLIAVVYDGADAFNFDVYPIADWIEGPYEGNGTARRYDGGHLSRAVSAMGDAFRGSEAQRESDNFKIKDIAFDFEKFHSEQYLLAPNYGEPSGDGIEAKYPTASATGSTIAAGTFLTFTSGESQYSYHDGFTCVGFYAAATNLFESVTLEILNGETVIERITLSPSESSAVKYMASAVVPTPLKVRLANNARFVGSGTITFEATEIVEYTPDHWDSYLLLRLAATLGGFQDNGTFIDGGGWEESAAKTIFDNYAQYGVIYNPNALGVRTLTSAVNQNPVYEAARKLSQEQMRIIHRNNFRSYEVSGSKSILRFQRYARGMHNERVDQFRFIAPHYETVSEVLGGIEYVVRSHTGGTVTYRGAIFSHNQRFTGVDGLSDYETSGDALLLEYNGIRTTAPKKGWSNEWLMFIETHFYHPSESSIWKTDSYADYFLWGNRCWTYAFDTALGGGADTMPEELSVLADLPGIASNRELHLSPEVPSGYTFALGGNSSPSANFCRSCQVYKKPYELESATVEFVESGDDIVELVFTERFQTHGSAPATVDPDPLTWSAGEIGDLTAEDYRTDDNAIRQYALYVTTGAHADFKEGDSAMNSEVTTLPDNPFGSIMPRFFFSRLIQFPYEDGNDSPDSHDTRAVIDQFRHMECWLKAACEGFVDGQASIEATCNDETKTRPYDYTFENLCIEAFGGRFIGDFTAGHGPRPNTIMRAALFNQISSCVNLLDKVRLEGFLTLEANTTTYDLEEAKNVTWSSDGSTTCIEGEGNAGWWEGSAGQGGTPTESGWVSATGGFAINSVASFSRSGYCTGTQFRFLSQSQSLEFRFTPTANYELALPPDVLELIDDRQLGVIGRFQSYEASYHANQVSVQADADGCALTSSGVFWDGTTGYQFIYSGEIETDWQCALITSGDVPRVVAPPGVFSIGSVASGNCGTASISNYTFVALHTENCAIIVVPIVDP